MDADLEAFPGLVEKLANPPAVALSRHRYGTTAIP